MSNAGQGWGDGPPPQHEPPVGAWSNDDRPAPPQTSEYADFGSRLGAFLLDRLMAGAVVFGLTYVLARNLPTTIDRCPGDRIGLCEVPTTSSWVIMLSLAFILEALYFALTEGLTGQTIGKKVLNIYVMDPGGGLIGVPRAIGRYLMKIPSAIVLLLGFLWSIWEPRKRTWHDMVVNSIVVKRS